MIVMGKKKFFINVISNILICLVIALLALTASNSVVAVIGNDYKPYYNGNSKNVSIMINVYWGTEFIEPMLETLEQYDAKATFFIGGVWAEKNMELLLTIDEKGHEIGNHGYLHRDHKKLSVEQNREEIIITSRLINNITGKKVELFAPPSGSIGNNMSAVCEELEYKIIMWSKDTIDWRDKDADLVFKRATKDIKGGDFILMHPTAHTLEALPRILDYYKELGIKSVTVTENITGNLY
ncbi:MAG: polysaccharide deacetylase family protein [Christensenellales bacterium]|jgi:peptidoglycan/xylan/chitin deacetylase (PgdA/CDA1 family)